MCNGGGNSVKKFADGGSTGTKSKSKPAPSRPDSGGSNPKPAPKPAPKPTVAAAPNRAKAGDASFQKSVGDRELDRLVQQNLSAPLPNASPVMPRINYETTGQAIERLRGSSKDYAAKNLDRTTPALAYANMPWSQYAAKLAENIIPSTLDMGIEAADMANNPLRTASTLAKGIGQLGYGAGSKIARNVFGYEGDKSAEAPLDAAIASTKGRYGLGEPGEFWKNLAEDPASYAAEIAGLRLGAGKVAGVVDDAQTAQYLRFLDDTTPKTDVTDMAGFQYYRPSPLESAEMGNVSKNNPWAYVSGVSNSGPNKTQQMYLDSVREAEFLRTQGAPEQFIQEQTGILTIPVKNPMGSPLGDLDVAAVIPSEMRDLRPSRANNYGANIFEDPELASTWYDPRTWGRGSTYGYTYKDPQTGIHQIGINPKISDAEKESTVSHEMTHADLEESGLGSNIVGASDEDMLYSKNKWLDSLKISGKAAKDPADKAAIAEARKKLAKMTSFELYSLNPGEMLARLSQGDPTMARRLTALEVLNPYINQRNILSRGLESLSTAIQTETRPFMSKLKGVLEPYGIDPTFDKHYRAPMDIDKSIVAGLGSTRIPRYSKK